MAQVDSTVCKFECTKADKSESGTAVRLDARYDENKDEDRHFSKWTPMGTLETLINNPNVDGFFEVGKKYLITITPAE